jgi:xanthine dehydrogenase accessory factor
MKDILPEVTTWLTQGEPVALATVIRTWGSSPRREGAKMALTPGGTIAGSVSGGCVEAAVFETGLEVLKSQRARLLHFGVADETAWQVGLACGGQIDVFVQPLDPVVVDQYQEMLDAGHPFAVATTLRGPDTEVGHSQLIRPGQSTNTTGGPVEQWVVESANQALAGGHSQSFTMETAGETFELFVETVQPAPALVIVGGVHIAIALAAIANTLGYATIVVDPRRAFGNADRFPHASRLIQAWPEEAFSQFAISSSTAIAMLTHDPKIDDPALKIALNSPAFYVGALGSRKTHEKRRQRLLAEGMPSEQIDRLHAPIGLALGGESPEEIALSIMAEIVSIRHQQSN